MKFLIAFILIIAGLNLKAQTMISQFTFNSNLVTQAAVGPNATSVSASATSSSSGVQGNGLNPKGTGDKQDVNMVIPGSPTFDGNSIEHTDSCNQCDGCGGYRHSKYARL